MQPGSRWRSDYAGWPALAKLLCVDELMDEVRGEPQLVRSRLCVESLAEDRRTLREHYREKTRRYRGGGHAAVDASLQRICGPAGEDAPRAAALLRRLRRGLRARAAETTGASQYEVHQALREVIARCDELALTVRGGRRHTALAVERLLTRLISNRHRGTGPRLPQLPV